MMRVPVLMRAYNWQPRPQGTPSHVQGMQKAGVQCMNALADLQVAVREVREAQENLREHVLV